MPDTVLELKVLVMNINDIVSTAGNDSMDLFIFFFLSRIVVDNITDHGFMLFEFFHFGAVLYIDSE